MAKTTSDVNSSPDSPGQGDAGSRRSLFQALAALAALTLVAAGSGTMLGLHLVENVETAIESRTREDERPVPDPRYAGGTSLHKVPPVVTNLASPPDVWVRLEASIILDNAEVASPDVLAGEIAEDMLAYLRTTSLAQIEGPSGLLHLHEDLNDRVAIRSNNMVRELIIETLVVQ